MRTSSEGKAADGKAVLISRKVQKQASRAKEKILQNLGKADKTTDEIFDDYVHNFNKQANSAARFQKEVNNYVRCVRAMQAASKTLFDTINEMYELEWTDRDVLVIQSQNLEMLWADFSQKVVEQVAAPLNHHMAQFPEYRAKIDKRGRKLLDYDSNRHALEALQSNTKKRDESKISKVREQLEDTRRNYESLNWELHQELPALYDSRIPFFVSNFQTICAAEALFHSECAKVHSELEAVTDKLGREARTGIFNVKRHQPRSPRTPSVAPAGGKHAASPMKSGDPQQYEEIPDDFKPNENGELGESTVKINGSKVELQYDIPVEATREGLPQGVLYRVRATYRYQKEDVDELSFDVGEIVQVIEFDDSEDQEEGWLMGVKENTGEKGLFPANFTRPI